MEDGGHLDEAPIDESAARAGTRAQASHMPSKWLLTASLIVCALLWFCDWTDYEIAGTWPNLLLPVAGIVAGGIAIRAGRHLRHRAARVAFRLMGVATLAESTITVVAGIVLAVMSPLGVGLIASSIASETQIGSVVSPDGSRVAEQYYRGGGLIGDDVQIVRVKYRAMPLMEREVYYGISTSSDPISWEDNDTLLVPLFPGSQGSGERIHLGFAKLELAPPVRLGLGVWELAAAFVQIEKEDQEKQKLDEEMSRPLKTVPLYPGGTENDYSGANTNGGGGFRAFDIKARDSDEAASWYVDALSRGEWSVVSTKRRETRDEMASSAGEERLVYDCIDSLRREPNGTDQHYYWRFLWGEKSTTVRVIVETPDPPVSNDCEGP